MMNFLKRTWAEINLNAISTNFKTLRQAINRNTKIMCIVKADGYGHGAERVSMELQESGADWFGVSNIEEALQLRKNSIDKPILILGYTPPELAKMLKDYNLTQTVFSPEYARRLSQSAQNSAVEVDIHIKLDTGMGRIGIPVCENIKAALDDIKEICAMKNIAAKGIYTHFARADEGEHDNSQTKKQFDLFTEVTEALKEEKIHFELRHCCNSAATLYYPQMHLDMIRPGIILYGLYPSPRNEHSIDLVPAMELKSVISMLKYIEPGCSIGYGHRFTANRKTKVATLPIGYADGYTRVMSGRASMLINGKKAPVIGTVSMDQCMIDVTDIENVTAGMTVTVIGRDGNEQITVEDISDIAGTINYETVCLIGKRVPRLYFKDGDIVAQLNYLKNNNNLTFFK